MAPGVAEAADAKPIAVYVEGPDADSVREEVLAVVPGSLKVLGEDEFSAALQKQGQKGQKQDKQQQGGGEGEEQDYGPDEKPFGDEQFGVSWNAMR